MGLDACAVEPGRRFVTERLNEEKKRQIKESRNLNPGLAGWVTRACPAYATGLSTSKNMLFYTLFTSQQI